MDFQVFNTRYRYNENIFFETIVGFNRLEQRNTDVMLHLWLKKYKHMNEIEKNKGKGEDSNRPCRL
jgi:hypothetical protein